MNNKLTTTEAAERLGISEDWLRHLLREGRIRGIKFGSTWMIAPEALDDYQPRPIGRPTRVDKAALWADFEAGMTGEEVARKHRCNRDYAYQLNSQKEAA